MTEEYYATFDGEVFRPEGPVAMEPNTRVRVVLAFEPDTRVKTGEPYCSLDAMLAMNVDGPPDWSERFHEYMYGENCRDEDD
ncbi:MAG: hypothetical protein ICV87_07995 [Gemmatimonadetes bacterium]|nr:hypothetical protein [Gemmatimonadota bacterium]